MTADVESIVIGAGVVGLAIARELALRGQDVLVLEQHDIIGSETSSRNSEVIHAGIYYPPGSLRARLCVEGKKRLYAFCAETGVDHKPITKLLVATNEAQIPKLKAIQETAIRNGVTDLVPLTGEEARRLEPEVFCVQALLSPSTGIVDSHGLMLALQGHAETEGAQVVLNTTVTRLGLTPGGLYEVETGGESAGMITARRLILSAGLHASKLARTLPWSGNYRPPETYYAVGQYYALAGKSPFGRHIYPMPDGAWLGLHVTVDIGGRCKFGPDIEWIPEIDYSFDESKLEKFLGFIRTYYPALDASRLHADYTGIRPKLYREGEPVPDFFLHGPETHGLPGLMLLFGIESPGLTASMALAEMVADAI
ncbi:MAG: NAD(P)/FAD-dependent oxidoreductase [Hyphomicrobiaceae bacterium]|nr:NAD(P)/FAD-dependent oxidoreductase [Hyphomicrobiaceae bacterium]